MARLNQSSDVTLTIMVVSRNREQCCGTSSGLQEVYCRKWNDDLTKKIKVFTFESMNQVPQQSPSSTNVDFISFFVNFDHFLSLDDVEKDILLISKAFMLDRLCLVCDTSQKFAHTRAAEVIELKRKYHLHVLWGDCKDENQRLELCERILNLASAVCGLHTGFPIITYQDRYRKIYPQGISESSSSS